MCNCVCVCEKEKRWKKHACLDFVYGKMERWKAVCDDWNGMGEVCVFWAMARSEMLWNGDAGYTTLRAGSWVEMEFCAWFCSEEAEEADEAMEGRSID